MRGVVTIKRYDEKRDLEGVLRCYVRVFAAPPWNETWTEPQVKEELATYLKQRNLDYRVALLSVMNGTEKIRRVIGFSMGFSASEEITPELKPVLPLDKTAYGKELAVEPEFENLGIGSTMLEERIERFRAMGFDYLAGRTDRDSRMVLLYKKFGYRFLGYLNPEYPRRGYWVLDL